MRLRDDPASQPYAEYILRVGNGTEPSILEGEVPLLPHGNDGPSAGVKIGLFPGIAHRANLDGLISLVFPDLPNKYAEEGYMDGRAILTAKNMVVNQIKGLKARVCLIQRCTKKIDYGSTRHKTHFCTQT
jgi:hypothetical protein